MFKVPCRLKKTYIPSVGGYKVRIANGYRLFHDPYLADEYAERVEKLTGVIVPVLEVPKR